MCNGLPIASLGGCVNEDFNRDGVANDINASFENIVVYLYEAGDTINPIDSMLTNADGKYLFDELVDGKYFVEFEVPAGYLFPIASLPVGNLTDRNGYTDTICVGIGEDVLEIDALLGKCYDIEIGHRNFEIVEGETVTISINESGSYVWSPSTGIDCTTCQIVNLTPDTTTTYTVQWDNQENYACLHETWVTVEVLSCSMSAIDLAIANSNTATPTLTANVSATADRTLLYQWQSSTISCEEGFSDIIGATSSSYTPSSLTEGIHYRVLVTETKGDKEICSQTSACISLGKIAGCLVEDTNRDGLLNDGNPPLAGVDIHLYSCSDLSNPIATLTTDENGQYCFAGLLEGDYAIGFEVDGYLYPLGNTLLGDFNANAGFSDCIHLDGGQEIKETLALGPCQMTVPTIVEATIIEGEEIIVTLAGAGNYAWSPNNSVFPTADNSTFILRPTESTTYTVTSENYYSCGDDPQIYIKVRNPNSLIKDPCSCVGGGTFEEEIQVFGLTPNDNWTVTSADGINIPLGTTLEYVGPHYSGLFVYNIVGMHESGIGYTLEVSNCSNSTTGRNTSLSRSNCETLSISNICFEDRSCNDFDDPEATPGIGAPACSHIINVSETTPAIDTLASCDPGCVFTSDPSIDNALYADTIARNNVHTICPIDPWHHVKVVFSEFDLAIGDTLFVYEGRDTFGSLLAKWSGSGVSVTGGWIDASCSPSVNPSGCLTFNFKTNGDHNKGSGWEAWVGCAEDGIDIQAPTIANNKIDCGQGIASIDFGAPSISGCDATTDVSFSLINQQGDTCIVLDPVPNGTFPLTLDLGPGLYSAVYFVSDDPIKIDEEVFAVSSPSLVCNDEINIPFNAGCGIELSPDDLLENPCQPTEAMAYTISVTLGSGKTITSISGTTTAGPTTGSGSSPMGASLPIVWITQEDLAAAGLDQCGGSATVTISRTITPLAQNTIGAPICDNGPITESCTTIINFQDQTAPVISVPSESDITLVSCDTTGLAALIADAVVIDNCDDPTINISIPPLDSFPCFGEDNSEVISISFNATDACGNTSNTVTKDITIERPSLFVLPGDVQLQCTDQRPDPSIGVVRGTKNAAGVLTTKDTLFLSEEEYRCGYILTPAILTTTPDNDCGTKEIIAGDIVDWCTGHIVHSYQQVLNFTDIIAPQFTVEGDNYRSEENKNQLPSAILDIPLDPWSCTFDATTLPLPDATDNCGKEVHIRLAQTVAVTEGLTVGKSSGLRDSIDGTWTASANALTCDTFRLMYIAEDACHEQPINDTIYCFIAIQDVSAPTAICVDQLNISLGTSNAKVLATDIDAGSNDACGEVTLSIRRMPEEGKQGTAFEESIDFSCEDTHQQIPVELKVVDPKGNQNLCWVHVTIEDKLAPICGMLEDQQLACDEAHIASLGTPTDSNGNGIMDNSEWQNLGADWNAQFGNPLEACSDNVGDCQQLVIQQQYQLIHKSCGTAIAKRRYRAVDWNGEGNPSSWVEQHITIVYVPNWSIDLPADWIGTCGDQIPDTAPLSIVAGACDNIAWEASEEVFTTVEGACEKVLRTFTITNWCIYSLNQEPVTIERPVGNGFVREGFTISAADFENVGQLRYTQILELKDTEAPIVTIQEVTPCITGIGSQDGCDERKFFFATATDCNEESVNNLTYQWTILENGVAVESGSDNQFGWYVQPKSASGITYTVKWTVSDLCGNLTVEEMDYDFIDCKQPTAYALHGINISLMATGMVDIWAADLNQNSFDNCTQEQDLRFGLWHPAISGSAPTTAEEVLQLDGNLIFNCSHIGTQEVRLYVIDQDGNWDYATTYIIVQDNIGGCQGASSDENEVMVSGTIIDWKGNTVEQVDVTSEDISQEVMGQMQTQTQGQYSFSLPMLQDYSITPSKDINPLNGVSTFDLVLISKHILGISSFHSPYQWIAADVNRSSTITAYDMVQLRRLILNIETSFSNNTAWRFVEADYEFSTQNPLTENFPEKGLIQNLHQAMQMDFVAIKVGDVNGSAQPNSLQVAEVRTSPELFTIETQDQYVTEGETVEVVFSTKQLHAIEGYQFTLDFEDLQVNNLTGELMELEHFGLHQLDKGFLTASWNHPTNTSIDKTVEAKTTNLFTVQFQAKREGQLSELLQITHQPTVAEAYDEQGNPLTVALTFTEAIKKEAFELYQNQPNPFHKQTTIAFFLPDDSEIALILRDETGRTLKTIKDVRAAGRNQIVVKDLPSHKGFIYYQLNTKFGSKTMKMIQVK